MSVYTCEQVGCTLTIAKQHFHPKPDPGPFAHAVRAAEYADRVWMEWLVSIGYGVDFTHTPPPPCEPQDLAGLYAETDGESVEDWTAILLDGNTAGGWYGSGEPVTDRPTTTSFTEADRLQARALLDEVMFGDHSNDSADAVIARALCAARAEGFDEGFAARSTR